MDEQLRDRAAPTPAWAWFEPGNAAPPPQMLAVSPLAIVRPEESSGPDPYLVCPGCGATMYERGCKLRCRSGYFLSCSDI